MIRDLSRSDGTTDSPIVVYLRPGQPTTTGNHQYRRMSSGSAEQALSRESGGQWVTGSVAAATRTEDEPVACPGPDLLVLVSEPAARGSDASSVAWACRPSLQPGPGHAHPQ